MGPGQTGQNWYNEVSGSIAKSLVLVVPYISYKVYQNI